MLSVTLMLVRYINQILKDLERVPATQKLKLLLSRNSDKDHAEMVTDSLSTEKTNLLNQDVKELKEMTTIQNAEETDKEKMLETKLK